MGGGDGENCNLRNSLWKKQKNYVQPAGSHAVHQVFEGRENLGRILKANEKRFRKVERRAADVIEAITNSGIKYDESEEVVNVCQAIQEMRKESERDRERRGELKKAQEAAKNFYNLGVDVEKIAQGVGYAVETIQQWLGLSSDN